MTIRPEYNQVARIKVFGIGGAGRNILNTLIIKGMDPSLGVYIDTDKNARAASRAEAFLVLGEEALHGLNTGADPNKGRIAAQLSEQELLFAMRDVDLLVLTAGLGGGVGSGATPVIADLALRAGDTTPVAVVTLPADKEGHARGEQAKAALAAIGALPVQELHVKRISSDVPLSHWFDEPNTWAADLIWRMIAETKAE